MADVKIVVVDGVRYREEDAKRKGLLKVLEQREAKAAAETQAGEAAKAAEEAERKAEADAKAEAEARAKGEAEAKAVKPANKAAAPASK